MKNKISEMIKGVKKNIASKYSTGFVYLLLSIILPLLAYHQDINGKSMISSDILVLISLLFLMMALVSSILHRNMLLMYASAVLIGLATWNHTRFKTISMGSEEIEYTYSDPISTGHSEIKCIVSIEEPIPSTKAQHPYMDETWRSALYSSSVLKIHDDHFNFHLKAYGSSYYLVYISFDEVDLNARGYLKCRQMQNHCEIYLSEKEGNSWEKSKGALTAALQAIEKYGANGDFVAITFNSGVALNSSGTVGAGIGPASLALSFPASTYGGKVTNGTGLWSCKIE